jgi:hypothetical protein
LELPIDHFRLLGVGPSTDARGVLEMLQQRLDRLPEHGYSLETLDARGELLRSSADLLSDPARRSRYETDLTSLSAAGTNVIPALDIPSSLEVGGLLLLLEAGQPLECFELANRSLQPPRAPALGSSREADLTLVAAQACLAGAADLQNQRLYEAAAQLLLQGQTLLQRMGQQPRLRQKLGEALDSLVPYRVLDLLSRPLTAAAERTEGLRLLDELVQRRGGLEGSGDLRMSQDEFQTFFRQIRGFLTVQEQVDQFTAWAAGSATADFLATTALTASGFVQRKPERIEAALTRLEASSQSGTETLMAALQLLLGRVGQAQQSFLAGASPELLAWAAQQGEDPLVQLCAYARDWLARDVLPGYRDLEADADLEAYFADRDVQLYIERHDPAPRPQPGPATPAVAPEPVATNPFASLLGGLGLQGPPPKALLDDDRDDIDGLDEPAVDTDSGFDDGDFEAADFEAADFDAADEQRQLWPWSGLDLGQSLNGLLRPQSIALVAMGLGVIVGAAALTVRQPWRQPRPIVVVPAQTPAPPPPTTPAAVRPSPQLPLTAAEPSEAELRGLLEAWLSAKASVLAGRSSALPLAELARETQVERLEAERRSDASRGETQTIETRITALEVLQRSPSRIALRATLDYSDSRLGSGGAVLDRTPATSLTNQYVFAREGQTWRLVAFGRDG